MEKRYRMRQRGSLLPFASLPALACSLAVCPAYGAAESTGAVIDWHEAIEIASGDAHRGPWRMNESDFRFVDDPTAALADNGRLGVAWVDQEAQDVYFQTLGPDGEPRFEEPVNVSNSPGIFSWLPRIAFGRGTPETVYVLWQEIVFSGGSHGGEIFFSRSLNEGEDFSEPLNLSNSTAGAGKGRQSEHRWYNGSLDLAEGNDNELYVAWTEYEGALRFSRSSNGGNDFSEAMHIAGNDEVPARGPSLAVGADGRIHLAWTIGEDESADIRYAVSSDGGESFDDPRIVAETEGYSDAPKLTVDSKGMLHLAYSEQSRGSSRYSAVYYTRLSENGEFETPREISKPLPGEFSGAAYPSLAPDGQDNLYLAWELFPAQGSRSMGLGYSVSVDGGDNFAAPAVVPGSFNPELGFNGSQQGLLMEKLAVNEGGSIAVVNSTFRINRSSHIRLFTGRITTR